MIKQKKAFTTMELLIVVTVVIALLVIGVPMISNLTTDLKMKELDHYAKSIYLEAQNQLIAMRAEGSLESFYKQTKSEYTKNKLNKMPQDFDIDTRGETWKNLYYLSAKDALLAELIPVGISFDGSFLIELNPENGNVYSVFYWEKDDSINYAQNVQRLVQRTVSYRKVDKLGYYGGDLEETLQESLLLDQQLEVVNSEELYVIISYYHSKILAEYYNQGALEVKFVLTDESGTQYPLGVDIHDMRINGDRMELYVLLDSMIAGHSFSDITEKKLNPGDDITIEVTTKFVHDTIRQWETGEVSCNSLFGSKSNVTGEIAIAAVRHLRNLDKNYYTYKGAKKPIITISNDIDFSAQNYAWEKVGTRSRYCGSATRPISSFSPIENESVFGRTDTREIGGEIRGNRNKLKNFVIEDEQDYVGIIRQISNMDISSVYVQDVQVRAKACAGGFAGSITGGSVSDSGVYLSTTDDTGNYYSSKTYTTGKYSDMMEERYHTYTISGSDSIGGFCGIANNVQFSNSFAAIMVTGTSTVGGFCGKTEGTASFTNCYSSGAVTANSLAGGFVGAANGSAFSNCYSTSDVTVTAKAGGFVSTSISSSYKNCISYAKVIGKTNAILTSSGIFLGAGNSTGDTIDTCFYLAQHSNMSFSETSGVKATTYTALKSKTENSASQSFPYSASLTGNAFPFTLVTEHHYGNWPGQYVIDTSIVYYEVYDDNRYGYYCVTTATELGTGHTDGITWVLNTLQDKVCVEDGYALLTLYNLQSFDYQLHIGSSADGSFVRNGTLQVSDSYGTNHAKLLRQQGELAFHGYQGSFVAETDFSTLPSVDQFRVTGMYLYQLPYELQTTDREGVGNFYDRFIIYHGIARNGNLVIGGTNINDEALTFYYCPHFAKTAVNPGITINNDTDGGLKNPAHVSVRSAKQLNALGRYTYYWNNRKGMDQTLYFIQETDISFSAYTNGTKKYCGRTFDLMDTSAANTIRNQPIGQPKTGNAVGQFNNHYDGKGYCIIDYRIESSNQFVGFFGEVENGTIQNIVMTVSKPDYGYIYGSYNDWNSTAVGGIVGLSYGTGNTIRNCSISGYEIKYISSTSNPLIYSINVGGLVGVTMSPMTNCAAICDVRVELRANYANSISMGGLAGSAFYRKIENSYAGGSIDISVDKKVNISNINSLAAGGITGAVLKIYNTVQIDETAFCNLYAYTKILIDDAFAPKKLYISPITAKTQLDSIHYNYGAAVPITTITFENCYFLDESILQKQTDEVIHHYTENYAEVTKMSYSQLQKLSISGMGKAKASDSFPISDTLKNREYPFPAVVRNSENEYVHYGDWPIDANVQRLSMEYPSYYEIYKDGSVGTYYVNFDGTVISTLKSDLEIEKTGYGILRIASKTVEAEALEDVEVSIEGMRYLLYENSSENPTECAINVPFYKEDVPFVFETFTINGKNEIAAAQTIKRNIYMNPKFGAAISANDTLGMLETEPLQVRTIEQLENVSTIVCERDEQAYIEQTRDIDLSTLSKSIEVKASCIYDGGWKNQWKLKNASIGVFSSNRGFIKNCLVEAAKLIVDTSIETDVAIFVQENGGTIENCYVKDSQLTSTNGNVAGFVCNNINTGRIRHSGIYSETAYDTVSITGKRVAGFAQTNTGEISHCFAVGRLKASELAAGFLLKNGSATTTSGTVGNSYANCISSSEKTAYGFVGENLSMIQNCYSAGKVESISSGSTVAVYGFGSGSGMMEHCYSVCELQTSAATARSYGFSDRDAGEISECYWAYSDTLNPYLSVSTMTADSQRAVLVTKLAQMQTLGTLKKHTKNDKPYSTSLGSIYPYPAVEDLVHYGDWPSATNK